MLKRFLSTFFICFAFLSPNQAATAQTIDDALALSARLLFTVSGGFWTENVEKDGGQITNKGYYRLSAFRRDDNTSALFLQKISNTAGGPQEVLTLELEEVSTMNAYITDMRPESSTGSSQVGFAAYVYLKTDPSAVEPETYSVYVDDLDEIYVEPASN